MARVRDRGRAGARVNIVTPVDAYLNELEHALRVRGRARRRFLRECRDHLADAAIERGEPAAVRAFGAAGEIAGAFDREVAARRGVRSTATAAIGVVATGGSTLALIHSATPNATAPVAWAVTFFVAAQVAGVAAALAILQALVLRRATMAPPELRLLARRNAVALVAAGVTMFAAGAALPGHGSAALLLAGPLLVGIALVNVLRARSLARRLDGPAPAPWRCPLADLRRLVPVAIPDLRSGELLLVTTGLAAAGAFLRDRAEQATIGGALTTAGIEAGAVVACFLLLGPVLGLWTWQGASIDGPQQP
jgi:hypothetical protein